MSDPVPPGPVSVADGAVLPGDAVRDLVERHERELESLADDLAEARLEADAVEARIRDHPALGLLTPDEVTRLLPPAPAAKPTSAPASGPPRTTVDRRPRPQGPTGSDGRGHEGRTTEPDTPPRSRASGLVTSHWVWKAGIAITVVALLLLKFG
ncbi:MAG: hypothetical protein ABSF84_15915 [Acidimicrobiales bacterium]